MKNVVSSPKTDMFRFRINPDVRKKVEAVYEKNGLSLTQAINIFIQQSLNSGGLPFPVSDDNAEMLKAKSMERLMKELEAGKSSGDVVSEEEVYAMLGVDAL
ncbi:MAG: type II toxin-antitoxin system RelB/DinJ family antitoxin [Eubacterium sp.]|nr:type II toxin-antitoxin system RelB/DinJ family antitoxin [Eubacterium sp.]